MHVREHVQLAAYLALNAPNYFRDQGVILSNGLEPYWVASKCRLDRWGIRLKTHAQLVSTGKRDDMPRYWNAVRPVFEEILVGDVLTRVWMSLSSAHDRITRRNVAEPIARSVFLGHMEARNRALTLLLSGKGLDASLMVPLNRLRRRCERWTDMLLGHIAADTDVNNFGYDQDRVREFGSDIRGQRRKLDRHAKWILLLESALDAFADLNPEPANGDLNQRIADTMMGCLGSALFDREGLRQPMWISRIMHMTEDTQALVDQLLSSDELESSEVVRRTVVSRLPFPGSL